VRFGIADHARTDPYSQANFTPLRAYYRVDWIHSKTHHWNAFYDSFPKDGHSQSDRTLLRNDRCRRGIGGVPNGTLGETYAP
jgi:hypothetical protein